MVERHVDFGPRLFGDAALLDVLRDSNHRVPGVIAEANSGAEVEPNTLPNRVTVVPNSLRQRFVDDDTLGW